LYRWLDELLPMREVLFGHLRERCRTWFGSRFEILLHDVTSTCFEGRCEREARCMAGTPKGRLRHFERELLEQATGRRSSPGSK